jgi:hypothetical protein
MTDYTTTQAVRSALDIDTTDEATLALAVTSASRMIDSMCGRNFGVTTSVARYFDPADRYCVPIHDAATVTAVATDDGYTGAYSTREAPFGSAGLADFGPVTIRGNRRVNDLLAPYKTTASSDGRFLVA